MSVDRNSVGKKALVITAAVFTVGGLLFLGGIVASIVAALGASGLLSAFGTAIIGIVLSVIVAIIVTFVVAEVLTRIALSEEEKEYIMEEDWL